MIDGVHGYLMWLSCFLQASWWWEDLQCFWQSTPCSSKKVTVWQASINGECKKNCYWSWWISASLDSSWTRISSPYWIFCSLNKRPCRVSCWFSMHPTENSASIFLILCTAEIVQCPCLTDLLYLHLCYMLCLLGKMHHFCRLNFNIEW